MRGKTLSERAALAAAFVGVTKVCPDTIGKIYRQFFVRKKVMRLVKRDPKEDAVKYKKFI